MAAVSRQASRLKGCIMAIRPSTVGPDLFAGRLLDFNASGRAESLREFERLRVIGFGQSTMQAARPLYLPVRSQEQYFSLLEFWTSLSGSNGYTALEDGANLVAGLTDTVHKIVEDVNELVAGLSKTKIEDLDEAKKKIEQTLRQSCARLRIPGTIGHILPSTDAVFDQLSHLEAVAPAFSAPANKEVATKALPLLRREIESGTKRFVKLTGRQMLVMREFADRIGAAQRIVAAIPLTSAALDLLAARTPEEKKRAFAILAKTAADTAVEVATDRAVGILAAETTVLVLTFVPVAGGVFTVAAISIGVGFIGIYLTDNVSSFVKSRYSIKLTEE